MSEATKTQAAANLEAQGILDPYKQPQNTYLDLARKLQQSERTVQNHTARNIVVGAQFVVSWHKDVNNARKALASRDAGFYTGKGYSVAIRTDIEVKTK